MKTIVKEKQHKLGHDYYLLGCNHEGKKVWLESAHFDCEWYWGFGYIEVFNGSNPETSTDIQSHRRWDSGIVGQQEHYDFEKKAFVQGEYVHHLNDNKTFKETTLTDSESWKLAELMKTFYILQKTAELYHMGGAHITENPLKDVLKNIAGERWINEELMPMIFKEVYKILMPNNE